MWPFDKIFSPKGSPNPAPDPEKQRRAALATIRQQIEDVGWHLVAVPTKGNGPSFLYTIGLWETYQHPELLFFSPVKDPRDVAVVIHGLASQVAQEGITFSVDQRLDGTFGDLPATLRPVQPRWQSSYLDLACHHHAADFPALQIYWPDGEGRFPWQSGFDTSLYSLQPVLYQDNAILAAVGWDRIAHLESESESEEARLMDEALDDLCLPLAEEEVEELLEDWRHRVDKTLRAMSVTLFGDVFLEAPKGAIHFLDTSRAQVHKVSRNRRDWLRRLAETPQDFFHAPTLLHARDVGYRPDEGLAYDWIQSPLTGGRDELDNLQAIPVRVRLSHSGRLAHGLQECREGGGAAEGEAFAEDDGERYNVVMNAEEQYSMWPEEKSIPEGWKAAGFSGSKAECLEYIHEVWTDMRPKSLREAQDG